MRRLIQALPVLLLCLAPVVAAAPDAPKLVFIQTESRIDIDAEGNVTAVRTTPQLPPEIQAIVESNLRKLRYAAPVKDGHAVSGVTDAQQDACAAPVDGRYVFAVKYRGNGPAMDHTRLPAYPVDLERRGVGSKWTVDYTVRADGTGKVDAMKLTDGGGGRSDGTFRKAISDWLEGMQFQPEMLDGQAIDTRLQTKVEFVLDSAPRTAREREHAVNDACKVALATHDDDDRAVAIDSPFKLVADN